MEGGCVVNAFGVTSVFMKARESVGDVKSGGLLEMLKGSDEGPVEIVGFVEGDVVGGRWGWIIESGGVLLVPWSKIFLWCRGCVLGGKWDVTVVEVFNECNLVEDDGAGGVVGEGDPGKSGNGRLVFDVEVGTDMCNEIFE